MSQSVSPTFDELNLRYPLPQEWSVPEIFNERLALGDLSIQMIGLYSKNGDTGEETTASAVGVADPPLTRAYFELIERITILAAEKNPKLTWAHVPRNLVFPISPEPHVWKYSRSNGVAAHPDAHSAMRAAGFELIERDRILRSWYGGNAPEPANLSKSMLHSSLLEHYRLQAYRFPGSTKEIEVAAVFGFPKHTDAPFFCGFGAALSEAEAISRAYREGLQRMSFLWGEPAPTHEPSPTPTPDFHLEYFSRPQGIVQVEAWLRGKHCLGKKELAPPAAKGSELETVTMVNLTLPQHDGKLSVFKAISEMHVPLIFGTRHPIMDPSTELSFGVHPIA